MKTAKPKKAAAPRERKPPKTGKRNPTHTVAGVITTHPSNGGRPETHIQPVEDNKVSIGEAMRLAVEALGPRAIDSELAQSQLNQLADALEERTRKAAAFDRKNDEAKTAKKALDVADEMIRTLVRDFTHPSPLPLFDAPQREADLGNMTTAEVTDGQLEAIDAQMDADDAENAAGEAEAPL